MRDIGDKFLVEAVHTFPIGTMLAHPLIVHCLVFGINLGAIEASPTWTMIAFRRLFGLLLLFISRFFGSQSDAIQALATWRVVAFR